MAMQANGDVLSSLVKLDSATRTFIRVRQVLTMHANLILKVMASDGMLH